jgi:hypothetical protein
VVRSRVSSDLPAVLEPIAFLLGTWRGEGHGEYSTIASFDYGEEAEFSHTGKEFLAYRQRTWALDDERPLHGETGFWRPTPKGGVELVLAHPTGVVEIEIGAVTGRRIELVTHAIAGSPTAKEVTRIERSLRVAGDTLTYELRMAAVGQPARPHLRADLRRAS